MRIFKIILTLGLGIILLPACSKHGENSANKSNLEKITTGQSVSGDAPNGEPSREDKIIIDQSIVQLKDPDPFKRVVAIENLRKTYSTQACEILVEHLRETKAKLPAHLDQVPFEEIALLVDYLGVLAEQIRAMNQPKGNEAVGNFMKEFRAKYQQEKGGQAQLAAYESMLKNVELGLKEGMYNKELESSIINFH